MSDKKEFLDFLLDRFKIEREKFDRHLIHFPRIKIDFDQLFDGVD